MGCVRNYSRFSVPRNHCQLNCWASSVFGCKQRTDSDRSMRAFYPPHTETESPHTARAVASQSDLGSSKTVRHGSHCSIELFWLAQFTASTVFGSPCRLRLLPSDASTRPHRSLLASKTPIAPTVLNEKPAIVRVGQFGISHDRPLVVVQR